MPLAGLIDVGKECEKLKTELANLEKQLTSLEAGHFEGFEPAWRAAFAFADAMTPTGGDVSNEIFAELYRWWTPPQIVEITSVIGFFNYFNRFAEALRIPVTR